MLFSVYQMHFVQAVKIACCFLKDFVNLTVLIVAKVLITSAFCLREGLSWRKLTATASVYCVLAVFSLLKTFLLIS